MLRRRIVPLSVLMLLGVGAVLAGCSSTTSTSTSTTTSGGGVSATTAPATSPSGSTPAAANTIAVTLNDTNGLNGPMTMVVAPTSAKAGEVTFTVTNKGTITHEMVVLQLEANQTWNGLTVTGDKVSEDGSKGETGDVARVRGDAGGAVARGQPCVRRLRVPRRQARACRGRCECPRPEWRRRSRPLAGRP